MGEERAQAVADRTGHRCCARGSGALGRLALEHAEATFAWPGDLEVGGLGLRRDLSSDAARTVIERSRDAHRHPFAIVTGGAHVGNVVLDLLDDHLGTARLSMYLGERAPRGAGVAQSAVRRVAEHAEEGSICTTVDVGNAPALEAYAPLRLSGRRSAARQVCARPEANGRGEDGSAAWPPNTVSGAPSR